MKVVVLLSILLAGVAFVSAQAKKESTAWKDKTPAWEQRDQSFPPLRGAKGQNVYAQGKYPTDYLKISNYGEPGVLIMGLGDQFNGMMATISVCDIWAIRGLSGSVNWHDDTPETTMFFGPFPSRLGGTVKTPQKSGTFQVTVQINGLCDSWYEHKVVPNSVIGSATAYVYESIPISSFQLNCAAGSPCPSIQGGKVASGVVTNTEKSPSSGKGTLVLISVSGPGSTRPYIIETVGLDTVSFDIETIPVTANTPLMVSVFSGGTTVTQTLTVTP